MRLKSIFLPRQLAFVLGRSYRKFAYMVYVLPAANKYYTFKISKRRGGQREINAPRWPLLKMQKQVLPLLEELYRPRASVNGFVKGRSTIDNARVHLKSRWILNIDLKDFFHSVSFGRIKGRLEANPYNLSKAIAHAIANIACFSGRLPQGGALSPILANMVADRLDGELGRLCRKYKCRYTRYADDITISTNAVRFPRALAYFDTLDDKRTLIVGTALEPIIESNDFHLNPAKTRLSGKADRQEVTGIIVNTKMNVPRTFVRQIRAMMHAWEKFGLDAAQTEHFLKWRSSVGRLPRHDIKSFELVLRGKLEFLRSVQGENQPVCRKLLARFNDLPGRRSAPYKFLPATAVELLNESTYCLEFSTRTSDDDALIAYTGTAFFLKDVGLVTCAHCVGENMEIYHPSQRNLRYGVRCAKKNDLADVALLELIDSLIAPPRAMLQFSLASVAIGDELRAAGFPSRFPEGALAVARANVDGYYPRSRHPIIWNGDETVRYMISRGVPDGVSGGPVLNASGFVIGVGAKGPGEDDALTPSEVVPISAVLELLPQSIAPTS